MAEYDPSFKLKSAANYLGVGTTTFEGYGYPADDELPGRGSRPIKTWRLSTLNRMRDELKDPHSRRVLPLRRSA